MIFILTWFWFVIYVFLNSNQIKQQANIKQQEKVHSEQNDKKRVPHPQKTTTPITHNIVKIKHNICLLVFC